MPNAIARLRATRLNGRVLLGALPRRGIAAGLLAAALAAPVFAGSMPSTPSTTPTTTWQRGDPNFPANSVRVLPRVRHRAVTVPEMTITNSPQHGWVINVHKEPPPPSWRKLRQSTWDYFLNVPPPREKIWRDYFH